MREIGRYWIEIVELPPEHRDALIDVRGEIRILLVEDDEDDFVLTRDLLADSRRTRFELDWVSSFDEALGARSRNGTRCLPRRLPPRRARRTGSPARGARGRLSSRPIILLTGQGDGEVDIAAMKAGAADYLVKGQIDAQILERSIRYSLEQNRTLEALRESEERYALSARGANDGLWVWDLGAATRSTTPTAGKTMLGFTEDEIGDSPEEWFSRVHPDDVAMLRADIDAHRHGATPQHRARAPHALRRRRRTAGCWRAAWPCATPPATPRASPDRRPTSPSGRSPSTASCTTPFTTR